MTYGAPLIAAVCPRGEWKSRRRTFVQNLHRSRQGEEEQLERKRKRRQQLDQIKLMLNFDVISAMIVVENRNFAKRKMR